MFKQMKIKVLSLLLAGTLIAVLFAAYEKSEPPKHAANQIYEAYQLSWQEMLNELHSLHLELEKVNPNQAKLQHHHLQARLRYKSFVFISVYLDPEFQSDFINGAPLPKLEKNFSQVNALEPKGFQPLEELIYENDTLAQDWEKAAVLSHELWWAATQYQRSLNNRRWSDYMVIEALRYGLVRFATLDLVGFDAPASGQNLAELNAAWSGMQMAFNTFTKTQAQNASVKKMHRLFEACRQKLQKEKDFDALNRLVYFKDYINPLFGQMLSLHNLFALPSSDSLYHQKTAFNYQAQNLFDPNILNPYYYTRLVPQEVNNEVLQLGQYLFFDPVLSSNNQMACASCHQPGKAYTDGLTKSLSNRGTPLDRNAPTLLNSVYSPRFFWDMRTNLLEDQFAHVIINEGEFNTTVLAILDRLKQSPEYLQLFQKAFPRFEQNAINQYTLNSSIAAYIASLRGFNSPFDQYMRGEIKQLPQEVQQGFNLFMGKALCGTCHFAPTFGGLVPPFYTEQESEVLGVPAQTQAPYTLDPDLGRGGGHPKEQHPIYYHAFKTVTVRNAAFTAPYMHNGVFQTLDEVVDFYVKGGGQGLGLEVPNQTLPFDSLSLNLKEQQAIIAFMQSLSDTSGLNIAPSRLPDFPMGHNLKTRSIGGQY